MKQSVLADLKDELHKLEIRHELTDDKQEKGMIETRINSLKAVISRLMSPERRTESFSGNVRPRMKNIIEGEKKR